MSVLFMKNELSKVQVDTILKALNHMVDEGPWESTPFLREIGKKIVHLRDGFLTPIKSYTELQSKHASDVLNTSQIKEDEQEIFISLYCAQGDTLLSWERILMSLPHQLISRPIYASEEDIRAAIRNKSNKINEAYVSIIINKASIMDMDPAKMPVDKLGKALLTLKDKVMTLDCIQRFVHDSDAYRFKSGRLIKMESGE